MATTQEPRASQKLHDDLTRVLADHGIVDVLTDLAQRLEGHAERMHYNTTSQSNVIKGAAYIRRARNVMFGRPKP